MCRLFFSKIEKNMTLDPNNIPEHVAIIMDGNGRWAKKRGAMRVFGHTTAIKSVREVTEEAAALGIKYLTLYTFSTENWKRPQPEVQALMSLLVSSIRQELNSLLKNNIKLKAIGALETLPQLCQNELNDAIERTKDNSRMTLVLALSYSGHWEILSAVNSIIADIKSGKLDPEPIDSEIFEHYLKTDGIPAPELLIRTSGEQRISNFLLWQIAYSELYFTDVLWPDFRKEHLRAALVDYQKRERRFGKTGEQIQKKVLNP
jgi:undecaprenyl diphosphate synthase